MQAATAGCPVAGGSSVSEVGMQQLQATVTLPFPDRPRAEAALRGWLRLAAADDEMLPDWSTLNVTELPADADERGRT